MAPSAAPAPTTVCSSSMNKMISPWDSCNLFEHGFEPLFELAAVFRSGDQRAHVQGNQLFVFQTLGHVAAEDALRQALRQSPFFRRLDRRSARDCFCSAGTVPE